MSQKLQSKEKFQYRKILSLIYLLALILPLSALYLANTTGYYNQYGWWLVAVLASFSVVDQLLGKEWANPSSDEANLHEIRFYYSFLLFLCLPAVLVLSVYGAYFFSSTNELNLAGRIGWIVSLGLAISSLALCAGHELIHREKISERLIGGFLIAFVCNASLKIEHIRGHHAKAATPADTYTAKLNQSYYHFLLQGIRGMVVNSWSLEKKRLNLKGHSAISLRNELISWNLVSLCIAVLYYFFFGLFGILFFIGQGFVALASHHLITYIQHYGLKRRKLDEGRYEKFSVSHAWNCNFLISNMASFCLPRHTDHHFNPRRPYPLLRHLEESPQMPMGYFGMFFMALIPSLWFKIMNPRILTYEPEKYQKPTQDDVDRHAPTSSSMSYIKQ